LVFFALLGSASAKAAHKMLVKSTPGVDYTTFYAQLFFKQVTKVQKRPTA